MVRVQDHYPVLDSGADLCALRAYDIEVAVTRTSHTLQLAQSQNHGTMGFQMELKNKRVLVVGLGRSGVSSAIFLQEHGAKVIVSDSKAEAQLQKEVPALLDRGISIETGLHGERTFRDQDLIVVSPGVPTNVAPLVRARSLGIPIIGELELASRF